MSHVSTGSLHSTGLKAGRVGAWDRSIARGTHSSQKDGMGGGSTSGRRGAGASAGSSSKRDTRRGGTGVTSGAGAVLDSWRCEAGVHGAAGGLAGTCMGAGVE